MKKIFSWFLFGMTLCVIGLILYGIFGPVYFAGNCEVYQKEIKVSNLKFNRFDDGSKIIVIPPIEMNLSSIVITNTEKVELAKQIIKKYPDDWIEFHYTKWNLLEVTAAPVVEFYDSNEVFLDSYRVRSDIIVYKTKNQIYWRCIPVQEMEILIEHLNIPDEVLQYP